MIYDGKRWNVDDKERIVNLAKRTAKKIRKDADKLDLDDKAASKMFNHGRQSEKRQRIEACVALARSEEGIPVSPDELDVSPWLLNTNTGTINLKTGEQLPHSKYDLITKLAPVDYDPSALAPRFNRFLEEVFIDHAGKPDYDLISYIQRLLGYSLTGLVSEQSFYICYGHGANGKGTLMNLIRFVMGDYGSEARAEMFLRQKRAAGAPSEDEADLQGRRLVKAEETDSGKALSEALVKRLTGTVNIKARKLHAHLFEFKPTHKLFLLTNHKPEIQGTDHSIWRRVHMIPFNATFTVGEDKTLDEDLIKEAPGVLNWLIEGCIDWQEQGLNPPKAVLDATQ